MKLRIFSTLLATGVPASLAQSNGGANSSYSRFGLGLPADPSQGFNRSMGGVAQGLRANSRINKQNPASYSAMDSLTFLFDVGMGLQQTRMRQDGALLKANNTTFDYVSAAFRLRRHLGVSVGFMPYTNIGYNFSRQEDVATDTYTQQRITQKLDYSGSGGLREVYVGAGWQPFKGFSLGFNVGYLWGDLDHAVTQSFAENGSASTDYSSLYTFYGADISTWKGDVGVQYQHLLNSTNLLTVGVTVGIGHKMGGDAGMLRYALNGDTLTRQARNAYELPVTYSTGVAWEHAQRLTLAADFTYEKWGRCTTPQLFSEGGVLRYESARGDYTDRWRLNAGVEYVPGRFDLAYRRRINYRAGFYYASPNLRINGYDGPKEFGIMAGIGLPIANSYTRLSVLSVYAPPYVNIGVQWTHRDAAATGFIREDVLRINIGVTFNERWFMKWKFR